MPIIFFLLWVFGLANDTYSSLIDYIFMLGYIISNKLIPPLQIGLINFRIVISILLNSLYTGFIGGFIEYLIKKSKV
ncbi:MAG: hypothetical protein AABY07_09985 [Nanoarchaeota archaeon]